MISIQAQIRLKERFKYDTSVTVTIANNGTYVGEATYYSYDEAVAGINFNMISNDVFF